MSRLPSNNHVANRDNQRLHEYRELLPQKQRHVIVRRAHLKLRQAHSYEHRSKKPYRQADAVDQGGEPNISVALTRRARHGRASRFPVVQVKGSLPRIVVWVRAPLPGAVL